MKITNHHKLPKTVVAAIKQVQSEYSGGGSFLSASGLDKPTRIFWLEKRHKDKLKQDAADLIWSLLGTLTHSVLEKSAMLTKGARAEERLYKTILGKEFSGQFDLIEGKTLYDHKLTSIWSVLGEPKEAWTFQGNANRLLLKEKGVEIDNLVIIAIIRDWSAARAEIDKTYPQTQIKMIPLPVWTYEYTEIFLEDKVRTLLLYENTPDDALPVCTKEERWNTGSQYAVMKKGNKRATKLFDNQIDAAIMAKSVGGHVEKREGTDKRCLSYCSVKDSCNYYQEKYNERSESNSERTQLQIYTNHD
jgi:hypothetical protein